jgi:exodeoxyribonuclease X
MNDLTQAEPGVVVLDIETTGLDPLDNHRIVQLAWQPAALNGAARGRVECEFVDPERDIPAQASAVNHITAGHVAGAPLFRALIPRLRDALQLEQGEGRPVLVAHNATFEAKFLVAEAIHAERVAPGAETERFAAALRQVLPLCTYRLALHLVDSEAGYGLQKLRYELGLRVEQLGSHSAGDDVGVTRALYAELYRRWLERREERQAPTAEQLVHFCWSAIDWSGKTMPRGKHKGQPVADVPTDYLAWVARKRPWAGYADGLQEHLEAELRRRCA